MHYQPKADAATAMIHYRAGPGLIIAALRVHTSHLALA